MWHLYEVIISNSRVWLKVQASCSSSKQSAAFFEYRFTGTDAVVDGHRPVTPFRLSHRSHYVVNWVSIVDRLPAGWDDDEFHIVGTPYPWCDTLSDGCECRGSKGILNAYCSDFGLHNETDRRASKSPNVVHLNYIQRMEKAIASGDESQREKRLQRAQRTPPRGTASVEATPAERRTDHRVLTDTHASYYQGSQSIDCPGVLLLDPGDASRSRGRRHVEAECDGVLADALVQRQQAHLRHQAASQQHRGQVNGVERSYRFARERQS